MAVSDGPVLDTWFDLACQVFHRLDLGRLGLDGEEGCQVGCV